MKKRIIGIIIILFLLSFFITYIFISNSKEYYTNNYFDMEILESTNDKDHDGIDDYADIYEGAKQYILTNPSYRSKYYEGGYPTDGYGVCTDVIWKAFKSAGYDLKILVDDDIQNNLKDYTLIQTPDPNIDFRRVQNLKVFFERNAQNLTVNLEKVEEWQAGDIVVFDKHIAICSNKRNRKGIPFIIHHTSNGAREANDMKKYNIIGHYRWN